MNAQTASDESVKIYERAHFSLRFLSIQLQLGNIATYIFDIMVHKMSLNDYVNTRASKLGLFCYDTLTSQYWFKTENDRHKFEQCGYNSKKRQKLNITYIHLNQPIAEYPFLCVVYKNGSPFHSFVCHNNPKNPILNIYTETRWNIGNEFFPILEQDISYAKFMHRFHLLCKDIKM